VNPTQALSFVADFVVKKRHGVNWTLLAGMVDYDLVQNPRLVRSQSWDDPDYPDNVLKFLMDAYRKNQEEAKFIIGHIVQDGDSQDALDPQYASAFQTLGIISNTGVPTPFNPVIMNTKYLDIESMPHDFYKELIEQINACYQFRCYPAAQILIRKLLENSLIDILRKKYGMARINLFYDITKGHFLDFSVLLDNISQNMNDFVNIKDSFNGELIRRINNYRDQGNASAHNINLDMDRVRLDLDNNRTELNFVVKSLFRSWANL